MFPFAIMKTIKITVKKAKFCLLAFTGVKLGLSCVGKLQNRLTRKTSEPKSETIIGG